jgi:hypothetical protein
MDEESAQDQKAGAAAWWKARRRRYNVALIIAGIAAFLCYAAVVDTWIDAQRPEGAGEGEGAEITLFTIAFQGVGYLIAMAMANVCYNLGPLSERIFQPADIERWRRTTYALGFGFSVALPFAIPVLTWWVLRHR